MQLELLITSNSRIFERLVLDLRYQTVRGGWVRLRTPTAGGFAVEIPGIIGNAKPTTARLYITSPQAQKQQKAMQLLAGSSVWGGR